MATAAGLFQPSPRGDVASDGDVPEALESRHSRSLSERKTGAGTPSTSMRRKESEGSMCMDAMERDSTPGTPASQIIQPLTDPPGAPMKPRLLGLRDVPYVGGSRGRRETRARRGAMETESVEVDAFAQQLVARLDDAFHHVRGNGDVMDTSGAMEEGKSE